MAHDILAKTEIVNGIGMEFVLIPAGEFVMGSPDRDANVFDREKPAHRVRISQPFYLGKYPVTQAQWQAVMGDDVSRVEADARPASLVSWEDAQVFMQKLYLSEEAHAYRLPTEAEWEYACRAGAETRYHFGDDVAQLDDYAWYSNNAEGRTHPVGQKQPNGWDLYDMHGNVWEWCEDWYGPYAAKSGVDPAGPEAGEHRVLRGGAWINYGRHVRSAFRYRLSPGFRGGVSGLRLVIS